MSFFEELKRRNVFRVGIAYGVAAWVLLQVADLVLENINAPEWVIQAMMMMVGLGFIAALVIAWAYEMTPEGIKKEADVDRSHSVTTDTGRKMDRIIIGFLVIAVAVLLYRQSGNIESIEPAPGVAAEEVTEPAASPESEEKSIAVLPFVNMSSDPEQEYFSDGLSEELLNRLAKNDQLHVAARTSAFQFKGQNLDIADIGRQLNVAHVLEGSVRKAGNRLRITAQLIQVDNGFHLWSETYERELDDVFAIQDEIAVAISEAMEIELGTSSNLAAGSKPTSNLEAYNLYLQARHLLAQRGDENMRRANELFAEAVALDPGFVSAWSGLAFNMCLLYSYSPQISLEESLATTMSAAQRAIELDPDNSEAYTAVGRALAANWDWKGAQESFERAYALGPNDVGVLNLYADFLWQIGDIHEAINLKKQAYDLDPLSGVLAGDFAEMSAEAGQFEEALVAGERGKMLAPQSFARINSLWAVLVTSGDFEKAWSLVEATKQSSGEDTVLQYVLPRWQAALYYRQGNEESLRKLVDTHISVHLDESEASHALEPALMGFYILSLDGIEEALRWLEQAYREKDDFLANTFYVYLPERISQDPVWLAFWNKPELLEIMEMRRANPYVSHGLWKSDSSFSETDK
jgi:TolB-like protein